MRLVREGCLDVGGGGPAAAAVGGLHFPEAQLVEDALVAAACPTPIVSINIVEGGEGVRESTAVRRGDDDGEEEEGLAALRVVA